MSRRDLVVFSLILVCAVVVFFLIQTPEEEVVELRETQGVPSDSGILVSSEPVNSYDLGYGEGYRAFLEQQGLEVPSAAMSYTVLVGAVSEVGSEEMRGIGYMDGYHKASESLSCPTVCPY